MGLDVKQCVIQGVSGCQGLESINPWTLKALPQCVIPVLCGVRRWLAACTTAEHMLVAAVAHLQQVPHT